MAGVHCVIVGAGGYAPIQATGGTESDVTIGGRKYRLHIYNQSGEFIVTDAGSDGGKIRRLVVGAGGGGGQGVSRGGAGSAGGGGAGDHVEGDDSVSAQTYPVTVGLGGAYNTNGGDSAFNNVAATGGGAGGRYGNPSTTPGKSGASGGGSGQPGTGQSSVGGAPTGIGYEGGDVVIPAGKETGGGGGGGGAAGPGGDAFGAISVINGGAGGPGLSSDITGVATFRAAGGGGAGCNASSDSGTGTGEPGAGGSGIGGNGARHATYHATNPIQNSGSGGGGGNGLAWLPSKGADGVVIIRYPLEPA